MDLRAALLVALLAALLAGAGACGRQPASTSPAGDAPTPASSAPPPAPGPPALSVRVPAALSLARSLDTLTISVDRAALATIQVGVTPGMVVGVESHTFVFAQGQARPAEGQHGFSSGADFELGTATWSTKQDGLPVPGTRYVVEMELVLFETDVAPGHMWHPHAGRYKALWTRTLRQAEE